ncbi:MAG: TAXI family TRAP transporter solute-binding subunit [Pseudomonadota bacterium]
MKPLLTAVLAALSLGVAAGPGATQDLIRAQVSAPGSTAYVVATHVASVLKQRHGYEMEVATGFPGIRSMINNANGEADVTLYAPALSNFLVNRVGPYRELENNMELFERLRVLFTFSGDLFTFATYDPEIRTLADLEDKRIFLGPQGAALVRIQSQMIEDATGLVAGEDYDLVNVDWASSPALLQDGTVDVLFQLCGLGCATWTELSAGRPLYFVGYTEEMLAAPEFQKHVDFPGRFIKEIPPGTWGDGQANEEVVRFVGVTTGLLANETMTDEVAYNIAKAFWETKDDLAQVAPFAAEYDVENAGFGVIGEMHAGSRRYLVEQGVTLD